MIKFIRDSLFHDGDLYQFKRIQFRFEGFELWIGRASGFSEYQGILFDKTRVL